MAAEICSMQFLVTQVMLVLQQAMDGYGFRPKEEELINYLKLEEPGRRGGFCIIPTIENIYQINPWNLPAKFREKSIIPSNGQEWWFISPQPQSGRIPRKTQCEISWKKTGGETDINAQADGQKIGYKKIITFPPSKGSKSNWVIHEYHLLNEDVLNLGRNSVLCHLTHKQDGKPDNSTIRSECGAKDMAGLKSIFDQPDGSFPEHVIEEQMKLLEISQNQNRVRFSLSDLLQLFQHALRPQNNSFPSTIHQSTDFGSPSGKDSSLDNSGTDESIESKSSLGTSKEDEWVERHREMVDAGLFSAKLQKGEEPRSEKVQQETAATNMEACTSSDETAASAKLFQHVLRPQNISFPSTIHQSTNFGSPSGKDSSLDNGRTDKSIESESSLGTSKDDEWVECLHEMVDADLLSAKVQKGKEPASEKVQQETAATNMDACTSSDETTASAKNGQMSMMENRGSRSGTVDGVEETEDIFGCTFNGPQFSAIEDIESYYDNLAAKELEHTKQNLHGNSPKRRRLSTPEKDQFQ